jgi:polyhydroxyalkanoate synthase
MIQAVWPFEWLDYLRRYQGRVFDRLGLGPRESPFRVLFSRPGRRLRCYRAGTGNGPALLLVPAPIKRPYIWDLAPGRSVVRRAIERGRGVYLVEWMDVAADDPAFGLADFAGSLLDECIAEIAAQSSCASVVLAGHSLGGVFAALYSAYRPQRVAALVLLETPLHFPQRGGTLMSLPETGRASALAPSARVPGSLLSLMSAAAAPATFCTSRYLDYLASIGSPELMATHWRVERWTMDELALPRALFDDVVEQLYRQNGFMRGALCIGGKRLHPHEIVAPLLVVYQPGSRVVPAESVRAFFDAAGSADKALLRYRGDVGVALQHVGSLVGDNAHREIWPRVFDWLDRHSACRTPAPSARRLERAEIEADRGLGRQGA